MGNDELSLLAGAPPEEGGSLSTQHLAPSKERKKRSKLVSAVYPYSGKSKWEWELENGKWGEIRSQSGVEFGESKCGRGGRRHRGLVVSGKAVVR